MSLEEKDLSIVIDAMSEIVLEPKSRIIQQGDNGDFLFVIEEGLLDCYKKFPDVEEEKLVKTVESGDCFGELALLYNCPRAASVESRDKAVLWRLDRETFNTIVRDAAAKKRELYDHFLQNVSILKSTDAYERSQIADALRTESFKKGDVIIQQGQAGDNFYIVEAGSCFVLKANNDQENEPRKVHECNVGDYFGELALLRNDPRAATVVAESEDVKVLTLDRATFKRLLGPLQGLLELEAAKYVA